MALLFVFFSAAILFLGMPTGHCVDIIGDILGGKELIPHSRPYMAVLSGQGRCGGTLISRNWVLTVAHCNMNVGDTVILGAHSLSDPNERGKQTFRVIQSIRHRNYNPKTLENDILLLKLDRSATLNRYVQTIQLPQTYEDVQAGTQCLVAGWGRSSSSDKLREAYATIQDRGICKKAYRVGQVTTNHLCAAVINKRKDECWNGESGGPLICRGIQRGITAFGKIQCAVPGTPDVYTRLTREYLLWINNQIRG